MHMDFFRSSSRKGRSRFSKALPNPPPTPPDPLPVSSLTSTSTSTRSKQLPSIPHPSSRLPVMSDKPLPPPQPLNQNLPPLPPLDTKALPKVHIPRRPIAKPQAPPVQQHSPSESIGSVMSAYSRSSGESLIMRSSDGSQRDSAPMYPSEQDVSREGNFSSPTLSSGNNETANTTTVASQHFTSNKGLPPAPSSRYVPTQPMSPQVTSPHEASVGSPNSFMSASSSPQRPIWRRRSVRSERNIEVPNLNLASVSHGSTAASQPGSAQPLQFVASPSSPQQKQQQFPPRTTSGLPGRNIRPVPTHALNPADKDDDMGQSVSKLASNLCGDGTTHSERTLSPTRRLPTPDYENEDVKSPVVDAVVSPISPASSPEPATGDATHHGSKPAIPRKAVTARSSQKASSHFQTGNAESDDKGGALPTIVRDFAPVSPEARTQYPLKDAMHREMRGQYPPFPLNDPNAPQPFVGTPVYPEGQIHPPISYMSQSRDARFGQEHGEVHGTVPGFRPSSRDPGQAQEPVEYREVRSQDLPAADPRLMGFPLHMAEPPSPAMVYNALPVKNSMLDCYQEHKRMLRTRNRNYSLTCQSCHKADTEDRFKCEWCYVRICAACMRVFVDNNRDLRKLLAHVEKSAQSQSQETTFNAEQSEAIGSEAPKPVGGFVEQQPAEDNRKPAHQQAQQQQQPVAA
ncbi:hypothetical protein C8034_v004557 [Colletotrichum sidae]|uniref:Uncharacterized protein n=1 Tax=Colletotrichum sidae TaxID=1347389 RepID=A0A4R8T7K5_9PEZI|nr:hypothetical protein C8034_v004557 [Colletotrichum sidae]